MKLVKTTYGNTASILKFAGNSEEAIPVTIDASTVALVNGEKILRAGTIVGGTGGANAVLINATAKASKHNTQGGATTTAGAGVDAEGILLNDVDCTYGDASGAMLIRGTVAIDKLPEAYSADAKTALAGRIIFVK